MVILYSNMHDILQTTDDNREAAAIMTIRSLHSELNDIRRLLIIQTFRPDYQSILLAQTYPHIFKKVAVPGIRVEIIVFVAIIAAQW